MTHLKLDSDMLASLCQSPSTFSLLEYQSNQLAQLTGESCSVGQSLKRVNFACNIDILKNVFTSILKKINPKVLIESSSLEVLKGIDKSIHYDLSIIIINSSTELTKFQNVNENEPVNNTIIIAPQAIKLPTLEALKVTAAVSLESDANMIQGAFIGALQGNHFKLGFDIEDDKSASLTPRQKEVLDNICIGKSNKEIARDMNLSLSTIKVHCMAIFKVLGVANRTQATVAMTK